MNKDIYEEPKCERFGEYAALGRVVSYTRSNGTKDFAIDVKKFVPIEAHLALLKPYEEPKLRHLQAKAIILKETLNLLDIEELDFGIYLPYEDVYQNFQNFVAGRLKSTNGMRRRNSAAPNPTLMSLNSLRLHRNQPKQQLKALELRNLS
jgi:hypothetical protein